MKYLFVIFALFSVNSFAAERPEEIFGYLADVAGVNVAVQSNNCTDKTHFAVVRLNPGITPAELALARTKKDECKRAPLPYGQILKFNYLELGLREGESFIIINPILAAPVF